MRQGEPFPFSGHQGLYFALLLLSIVLFLGLAPIQWKGVPVRGVYYYFYTYFPGFDGIRKVSRQAVMTTFGFCLLSSFGSSWLFSRLSQPRVRTLVLSVLLVATGYELRCFPHPMRSVWAADTVPQAYRFMATLPPQDLLAFTPQGDGVSRFWGDRGMALYNYLSLYHKHRFVDGQGSYMPPVTELARRALHHLPDDSSRRMLQLIGARHILVDSADLPGPRRHLAEALASQPEHYRRIYQQGAQSVFSLSVPEDPTLALLGVPALPPGARPVPRSELRARSNLNLCHVRSAIDGNVRTFWVGGRGQARGQYFELRWDEPRPIVAFEIENGQHVIRLPASYQLSVGRDGSGWQKVAEQPLLRLYREQIYSPKTFVFRIVLKAPVLADRIRITIGQPVPGYDFAVHEARVYVRD
jgi:hypothetical protein